MGMAASQARLLSITARLSNNELEQQSIAYSKQRLSENSEQINDSYLDALAKTKYQVLTGYNGTEACYQDLTYNQITGINSVAANKQYLVKDNKGSVLVTAQVANAFKNNNGDFNRFLRDLGYTQADIDVKQYTNSENAIHNAWDEYLSSVGKSINDMDSEHILGFDYTAFSEDSFDGYATYSTAYTTDSDGNPISLNKDSNGYYKDRYLVQARRYENEHGEIGYFVGYQTPEQEGTDEWQILEDIEYNSETGKFLYYRTNEDTTEEELVEADALYADTDADGNALFSEEQRNYLSFTSGNTYVDEGGISYNVIKESKALNFEGVTTAQRELYDYAVALTEAYYNNKVSNTTQNLKYDANVVNHYKNIFNEMRTSGYTTTSNETNLKDNDWFVRQLKAGKLVLSYYSTAEKKFIGTTLDNDESITEKEDKSAMTIAEQVYQSQMDKIESQDKQFDLQLNKLESEHNALQTEYDSVKGVISKNVEKTFNIFNA